MPIQKISKADILHKSREVFWRQGYFDTSMSELAAACGLFKGSFYHHFSSKEALMVEILEMTRQELQAEVFSISANLSLTPQQRLAKMLIKLGKTLLLPDTGCFIGNTTIQTAHQMPEFADILRGVFDDWRKAMALIFATRFSPEVANTLADQTLMELQGAVMLSNLYKNQDYLKDAFMRATSRLGD
jgi:TetR/AcrR family transcriptional regulator, transcriptional repressor for nem operon